jgi:catechol 2,3-dioxygenase-like lactoylglutathione lyase family enzyme
VLGRFLEYSVPTADIRASLDFYLKLGFAPAEVGETWPHPYAVVTDGRVHVGLHGVAESEPTLTFVKPELIRHFGSLEELGIEFDVRRLGNDVFNELSWIDPCGHRIRLIEARTFNPIKRAATEFSRCGYFQEIGLPCPDLAPAKDYWEKLGFVGIDEFEAPLPHVACTSDSIDMGLYEPAHLPVPGLVFDAGDLGATLRRLADEGLSPEKQPRSLRGISAAMLMAPEGTPIILMAETAG